MPIEDFDIRLQTVTSGFDGRTFWAQARAGAVAGTGGSAPLVVLTAQPALRSGSDVFFELHEWHSRDYGHSWVGPIDHKATLGRRQEDDETIIGICDMTPAWHATSGKLLATGHTVRYRDDRHPFNNRRREPAYSVYNAINHSWAPWRTVELPDWPSFHNAGAGSGQRFDLEDGTVLLPVYFREPSEDWHAVYSTTVLRCAFDGESLRYLGHGNELRVDQPRGLCEPSITRFGGRFYMTLRNDVRGYVARSDDGLVYGEPLPWRWDDGSEIGNYNTQQHWVSGGKKLYLVYTRRGLNNDHVFRHRAPLMIAEVDPDRLVLRRATEREVVPNRGARLGNFAICQLSPTESWVVVSEWMQPVGCETYGSDNTIWTARLLWH